VKAPPPAERPDYAGSVLSNLPAAVFVIDGVGTVAYASERAAALVGARVDDVIGRSVLEFVSEDTAWSYAAAVAMATDYAGMTMGPLRITVRGVGDVERTADLWATNHLDDPDLEGIVCLLTEETTAMGLGEAVAAVAGRDTMSTVASRVVAALRGHPVVADAVVQLLDDGQLAAMAPTPVPDELIGTGSDAFWVDLIAGGNRLHTDLDDLPDALRTLAVDAGYRALWIEPVPRHGDDRAALVLWRPHAGKPSPNELSSVYQAGSILGLAFRLERL
jgi:hypothetical protein